MIIKDVRLKKRVNGKENPYWQGYLDNEGVNFLTGYDYARGIIDSAFDSLENDNIYGGMFRGLGDCLEQYGDCLTTDIANSDWNALSDVERIALIIREQLAYFFESDRDSLVTSLIDSMNDEEYEKIIVKVNSGERKTPYTE